ncbi:MAG: PLDc N-terminal domain-containing protein [Proteobacteria bacterium]|nr:PLDc N-terminal domain-containing protein [Pseudomonadota bacterium]
MGSNLLHTITVWTGIGFIFLAVTMIAFMDVAKKNFGSNTQKSLWAIITLIPFVGWLFYLIFGFRKGKKK